MNCPYAHTPPSPPLHALNAAQTADTAALQSFYQDLSRQPLLQRADDLGLWIAAAPHLVRQALAHPDLGVRPPTQPVPEPLQGRAFGRVYAQWLRMRDDAGHGAEKTVLQDILREQVTAGSALEACARRQARQALSQGWHHWQWRSVVASVGDLLGLPLAPPAAQEGLMQQLRAFAQALPPHAGPAALAAADLACERLRESLSRHASGPLWQALQAERSRLIDPHAHALSLLWQGYEAGAALLGQAALQTGALQSTDTHAEALARLQQPSKQLGPIHHTRRWAQRDCELAGQALARGEALLLVLVGENQALGYGHGRHQCPGRELALHIGAWSLLEAQAFLGEQGQTRPLPVCLGFEPLPNARIPMLGAQTQSNAKESQS